MESFVRALLLGLASLHQIGIAHGDLRLSSIHIDGDGQNQLAIPWITGAQTGGLAHWSKDSRVWGSDEERTHLFPPESDGRPPQPSPKADLYASDW